MKLVSQMRWNKCTVRATNEYYIILIYSRIMTIILYFQRTTITVTLMLTLLGLSCSIESARGDNLGIIFKMCRTTCQRLKITFKALEEKCIWSCVDLIEFEKWDKYSFNSENLTTKKVRHVKTGRGNKKHFLG